MSDPTSHEAVQLAAQQAAQAAFLAKKKAKQAARRNNDIEEGNLNITSLMDIVSIIVVYLLKSYGTDPVVITPTAGQKVPMSLADAPIQDGVPVYVSQRSITFGSQRVVQLDENGDVDPTQVTGQLIGPLFDLMSEEAERSKQTSASKDEPWEGTVILVGDVNLKFSTLVKVMYTAGKAEYSQYAFCIIQLNG
ncbi:MAG: biopolymer transporter ExbD [Nannocystaceae bacterium]|nr:biopolymer transporter ExbD [Nannocystaceae bacterium]